MLSKTVRKTLASPKQPKTPMKWHLQAHFRHAASDVGLSGPKMLSKKKPVLDKSDNIYSDCLAKRCYSEGAELPVSNSQREGLPAERD
jgi:hypothetical protein